MQKGGAAMRKMKILLSVGGNDQNYIDAIEALGAEAVAKYSPEVDTDYDGLILCGGADMHPSYYGEEICGSVGMDLARDEAEVALLQAYATAGKPILGICRGHQLINVFFGGSLYQDIAESELHKRQNDKDNAHVVSAVEGSILAELYGESFSVNSAHHQAIKELGAGLRATAYWNGQYIEAIEHGGLPILAVQWHPERMCFKNKREDTVCGADIIKYFVDLCASYTKK